MRMSRSKAQENGNQLDMGKSEAEEGQFFSYIYLVVLRGAMHEEHERNDKLRGVGTRRTTNQDGESLFVDF
jgi:hypothetical protein